MVKFWKEILIEVSEAHLTACFVIYQVRRRQPRMPKNVTHGGPISPPF